MDRSDIAVFLDRDGTVNAEVHFLSSPDKLQLIPRTIPAIRELNDLGVKVFIITNQSGVARGIFPESEVSVVHVALREMLKKENALVDDFFYCPHLPGVVDARYNKDCECRKPRPGMIFRAGRALGVDFSKSFVVGDKISDVALGPATGMKAALVRTGFGERDLGKIRDGEVAAPDFVAGGIGDAVDWILGG